MSPIIRKALYAIVILVILALLILSFQKNFEYVEQTEWRPLTGEARTNPLYASKLFLRRMGIPTKMVASVQDLTTLPDTDTVILINTSRKTLRPEPLKQLLNWTRRGGHLIISGVIDWQTLTETSSLVDEPTDSEVEPIFYDELDEALTPVSIEDPIQAFLKVKIGGGATPSDEDTSEMITINGSDHPLEIRSVHYYSILLKESNEKIGLEQVAIDNNNIIIRQQVDKGLITLVSHLGFIDNYWLKEYDHAEILWQIVQGKAAQPSLPLPAAVWLIHSDETTSLLEIIWSRFWALVITLALLLLLWIARVSRRFGPLIPKAAEDRRNLLEHIDASGLYYWKRRNHEGLLESTRSATQQQLAKRIPGWQALAPQDQIPLLAKRLNINEPRLLKALYGNISASAHEFTETIKQLEHIRTNV